MLLKTSHRNVNQFFSKFFSFPKYFISASRMCSSKWIQHSQISWSLCCIFGSPFRIPSFLRKICFSNVHNFSKPLNQDRILKPNIEMMWEAEAYGHHHHDHHYHHTVYNILTENTFHTEDSAKCLPLDVMQYAPVRSCTTITVNAMMEAKMEAMTMKWKYCWAVDE